MKKSVNLKTWAARAAVTDNSAYSVLLKEIVSLPEFKGCKRFSVRYNFGRSGWKKDKVLSVTVYFLY